MKILEISDGKALFSTKNKANVDIKAIEPSDILEIIEYIMKNDDFDFDDFTESNVIENPAERLIYVDLLEQFKKVAEQKETNIAEIESKFAEADRLLELEDQGK